MINSGFLCLSGMEFLLFFFAQRVSGFVVPRSLGLVFGKYGNFNDSYGVFLCHVLLRCMLSYLCVCIFTTNDLLCQCLVVTPIMKWSSF